jgi:DNA helicase IV
MNLFKREELLSDARAYLVGVTSRTKDSLNARLGQEMKELEAYSLIEGETEYEDRMRAMAVRHLNEQIIDQLRYLTQSPYFVRCDVEFVDTPLQSYYFGKYANASEQIYSWTSPLARLRFDEPGNVAYALPDGEYRKGVMKRKDQFLIAQAKLRFMATESIGTERQLIHQEHLTNRKTGFVLPEIVAQMEKAQDQVIRTHHVGSMVISGPAGSGKTTLALHRIAYLVQSTDLAALFRSENILVFVNDYQTQDYFSHLLPELGINDVTITTFPVWAIAQLELRQYFYRYRPGDTEADRDEYEWAKQRAFSSALPDYDKQRIPEILTAAYMPYLSPRQRQRLASELDDGALDRTDLTILLTAKSALDGGLKRTVENHTFLPKGRVRTKLAYKPLTYSLILIDEFQNYSSPQLRLLKSVVAPSTKALLYVGDIAQRTSLGAMGDWSEIGENLAADRLIHLEKVYRNPRAVLEYMRALGYEVIIPDGVEAGKEVIEFDHQSDIETLRQIKNLALSNDGSIGVLARDDADLEAYRIAFSENRRMKCLTIRESQGVEFDVVCLVAVRKSTFAQAVGETGLMEQQRRINRDLLYVALTRSIRELYIFGPSELRSTLKEVVASGK